MDNFQTGSDGTKERKHEKMLVKIGVVTRQFDITHRSLRYWEDVGIIQSVRGKNGYRYYDEKNIRRIQQILLLRKLQLSIPAIHTIFTSGDPAPIIAVFTDYLDETVREEERLHALATVLRQLIAMLNDHRGMDEIFSFLEDASRNGTDELRNALAMIMAGADGKADTNP